MAQELALPHVERGDLAENCVRKIAKYPFIMNLQLHPSGGARVSIRDSDRGDRRIRFMAAKDGRKPIWREVLDLDRDAGGDHLSSVTARLPLSSLRAFSFWTDEFGQPARSFSGEETPTHAEGDVERGH
jgi:hypothetical protein